MAFGNIIDHEPCKGCKYYDDDDTDMEGNVLCSVDLEICKDTYANCNTTCLPDFQYEKKG